MMAIRSFSRFCAFSVRNQWSPDSQGVSRKLYNQLSRWLNNPARSTACVPPTPATWAPVAATPSARSWRARSFHTAAAGVWCKDVDLGSENPFYDKYSGKLDKIEGLSKQQTRAKIKAVRLQEKSRETAFRPPSHPTSFSQYSLLQPPLLESVMHTDLIADKSVDEIGEIWREYHKTKDVICAVIPANTYIEFLTKAIHCPYFVYPLPRDEGYEFMFGQFSGHRCHFTSLINYQQHQENAPVSLTLTHYTDLQESKGIVLMAGEVDTTRLTTMEAQYLANQVQLYYGTQDEARYGFLRQFNHEPETFNHHKLIEQLENSSITSVPVNSSATQQT